MGCLAALVEGEKAKGTVTKVTALKLPALRLQVSFTHSAAQSGTHLSGEMSEHTGKHTPKSFFARVWTPSARYAQVIILKVETLQERENQKQNNATKKHQHKNQDPPAITYRVSICT